VTLRIDAVHHHDDFDGVVAAGMLVAWQSRPLATRPVTYGARGEWLQEPLVGAVAVVDFLFRPDAALWIDHHDTTFQAHGSPSDYAADEFHVWDPSAESCPAVIAQRPWFPNELRDRFREWVRWADVVDSALYESPRQALDLENPYLRFASSISRWVHEPVGAEIVRVVASGSVREVLEHSRVSRAVEAVIEDRDLVSSFALMESRLRGAAVLFDQGDIQAAYQRYLPYQRYPECSWSVAIYRAKHGFVVSVGENPWNRPLVPVHLGHLCERHGGGGRQQTAGIPAATKSEALRLAESVLTELGELGLG